MRGDRVDIWLEDDFLFTAFVDLRSEDGVLWVVEEGAGARKLFLHTDGVTLYPASAG